MTPSSTTGTGLLICLFVEGAAPRNKKHSRGDRFSRRRVKSVLCFLIVESQFKKFLLSLDRVAASRVCSRAADGNSSLAAQRRKRRRRHQAARHEARRTRSSTRRIYSAIACVAVRKTRGAFFEGATVFCLFFVLVRSGSALTFSLSPGASTLLRKTRCSTLI